MSTTAAKTKLKARLATATVIVALAGLAGVALESNPAGTGVSPPAIVAAGSQSGAAKTGRPIVTSASGAVTSIPIAQPSTGSAGAGRPAIVSASAGGGGGAGESD